MSISQEIKKLAETLSHIEEGDSVSPMHGTLADLVNIVRGRDHAYKGTQGWGSKFGLINQHNEVGNVIIVFADNGLGQIWIKVPQKNIDQAKVGAKTKKPDLSTLVPLDGVEVKYTDDEQDINWHGSAQNFIPLFNKGKFPKPSVTVPNDGQQSFYQGLSWDKAGTVQNLNAEADPKDPKFTYKDLGVGDPLDDQPANDDVYESLAEQIKALTNTLSKIEEGKSIHQELSEDWKDDIKKAAGAAVLGASLLGAPEADAVTANKPVSSEVKRKEKGVTYANPYKNALYHYFLDHGITDPVELALVLSNSEHETKAWKEFSENLRYTTPAAVRAAFHDEFSGKKGKALIPKYLNNPVALGNRGLANKIGNGDERSGDGWRYRGRGYFHLTGKDHYKKASDYFGVDFVKHPDKINDPKYQLPVALWYWKTLLKPNLPPGSLGVNSVTKVINSRDTGNNKASRASLFREELDKLLRLLGIIK